MRTTDRILERLLSLHPKVIDLSLDRMYDILDKLGNPHHNLPPIIHVAGTNGKGSTISYIRSILEKANLSIHVYTSPHLVRFNERIRLAGKLIDEVYLQKILEQCEEANNGEPITYFEITTAAAFKAFADNPADVLILEVGLGGRLDATNVIDKPLCSVITPISLDHEQFLGTEIKQIANEKAHIAKTNCPVIVGQQIDEARIKVEKIIDQINALLVNDWDYEQNNDGFTYHDQFGTLKLPNPNLNGLHQISNAALAIATLRHQTKFKLNINHYINGITSAKWPARMQNISESRYGKLLPVGSELWIDGGHNPAAGKVIADTFKNEELILICGMMSNKNTAGYLEPLAPITKELFGIHVEGEASYSATEIVKFAWALNITAETALNVENALRKIKAKDPVKVLICGSLYLSGQVLNDNDLIPD